MRTLIFVVVLVLGLTVFGSLPEEALSRNTNTVLSFDDKTCEDYWFEIICFDDNGLDCWQFNYCGDTLTSIEPINPY